MTVGFIGLVVLMAILLSGAGYLEAMDRRHKNNMELCAMEKEHRLEEKNFLAEFQMDEEFRIKIKELDELKAKVDKLATKVAFKL